MRRSIVRKSSSVMLTTTFMASTMWLASGASLAALAHGADASKMYTDHASHLRRALLSDYEPAVAPRSVRATNYSEAGTDVYLQLRFFNVANVELSLGMLHVHVWMRMSWVDERLRWDPADYGDVRSLKLFAGGHGDVLNSDIWLPDVLPYNAVNGLASLERADASVQHTGEVFWSRTGLISLSCRFSGLVMFPYDRLSCPIDVGGWQTSGLQQGLLPAPQGAFSLENQEEVAHSSYTEYSIETVTYEVTELEYAVRPRAARTGPQTPRAVQAHFSATTAPCCAHYDDRRLRVPLHTGF